MIREKLLFAFFGLLFFKVLEVDFGSPVAIISIVIPFSIIVCAQFYKLLFKNNEIT